MENGNTEIRSRKRKELEVLERSMAADMAAVQRIAMVTDALHDELDRLEYDEEEYPVLAKVQKGVYARDWGRAMTALSTGAVERMKRIEELRKEVHGEKPLALLNAG